MQVLKNLKCSSFREDAGENRALQVQNGSKKAVESGGKTQVSPPLPGSGPNKRKSTN